MLHVMNNSKGIIYFSQQTHFLLWVFKCPEFTCLTWKGQVVSEIYRKKHTEECIKTQ